MAIKIQTLFKLIVFKKQFFRNLKKLVFRKKIWKRFAEKQRIVLLKYAKGIVNRFCEEKKKKEE